MSQTALPEPSDDFVFKLTMDVTSHPNGGVDVVVNTDPFVGHGLSLKDCIQRADVDLVPGAYVFTQVKNGLKVEHPKTLSVLNALKLSEEIGQLMSDAFEAFVTTRSSMPTPHQLTRVAHKILMRLMINQCTQSLRADEIRVVPVCGEHGDNTLEWQDQSFHTRHDPHMEHFLSDRPIICSAGKASVWVGAGEDWVAEVRIGLLAEDELFSKYFNTMVADTLRERLFSAQAEVAKNAATVIVARYGPYSDELTRLIHTIGQSDLINMSLFRIPLVSDMAAEA